MDFDAAIRAHADWTLRLTTYLRRPDGSLDAAIIGRADACLLGTWLRRDAARFGAHPEYDVLRTQHALFHRAAAQVVADADGGHAVSPDLALGATSAFGDAAAKVVGTLTAMKHRVAA